MNRQLTSRKATLVTTTRTAPVYRLYALPAQPPKAGLVRVGDVEGAAAIEVEVWEVDPAGFASFVDELPEPFGVGRVTLEDGSDVAGLLCEAVAVEGAPDVSHLGGWRAYRATQPVRRARPHSRPGRAG